MTDLGNDRLRIIIQLLSPQGEIAYESHPFEINTMSPDSAYSEILEQSATALGLMAPAKKHQDVPITNPASLSLYAHGLASYLLGQVANSDANIRDAASLNGPSALLMSRQEWSESDLLGGTEGGQMLDDYHRLLNLPDPDRVVRERLLRGHQLGSPALPGTSGNEMDDPYKPPRPEPLSP